MTVRRVEVASGIELDVIDEGSGTSGVAVLLHGFPESSHSWRHQVSPLVDAGWRVLIPDQRGYASSSAPPEISAYRGDILADDVIALLDDIDADDAVIIGHDWGAIITWHIGQLHPSRCRALIAASVPFTPWPIRPTENLKAAHGDNFFYILYFQTPGIADEELNADPERFLLSIAHMASGEGMRSLVGGPLPAEGTRLTDYFEHMIGGRIEGCPPWMTEADLKLYTKQFTTSGFTGPINWYRNLDANFDIFDSIGAEPLTMPTFFIAGDLDPVILGRPEYLARMNADLPNHQATELITGIGHWVQQEAPDEFNRIVLRWLDSL